MIRFSNQIQNKTRLITRRMFVLGGIKLAVFFSIVARLFYLQISENIKYRSLSDKNRLREWKVLPQRGIIEDFFGEKIANNTQSFQLHMLPEEVPNLEVLLFKLSKLINFDRREKTILLKKIKKRKPWQSVIVSDNLTWSEFSKLNLFLHEVEGIKPVIAVTRKYSQDGSSSHFVGYVSDVSKSDLKNSKFLREIHIPGLKIGKTGLEKYLNESIIGRPGFQRFEVNAYGKRIKEVKSIQGTIGENFKTTLDIDIQRFASELIKNKSGSICIMDIYTGDIIAMVSSPTFDANKFVHGIAYEDWQNIIKDPKKPLMNRSITGLYPPGSTIKPIVALSALEHDVISPELMVECRGKIEFYGQKYHCWRKKGHGYMKLKNAIKQSCDIYFYEVARLLGVDRLAITAKKFGLGNKVFDIFNEEQAGIVPSTKWKLKNIGKGWVIGETLITGIGQGYFQVTPIQLCLMTAQLANGGYKIEPRIFHDINTLQPVIDAWRKEFANKDEGKSNLLSEFTQLYTERNEPGYTGYSLQKLYRNPENVKFVLDALYGATNEQWGTSYESRHTKSEYIFAGKTGTAQIRTITEEERKLNLKSEDQPYELRDHALFIAYAPYKNPRYAFSVVIEHGGTGGLVAAPIAKKLIKKVIDRHQLRKKYQQNLLQEA